MQAKDFLQMNLASGTGSLDSLAALLRWRPVLYMPLPLLPRQQLIPASSTSRFLGTVENGPHKARRRTSQKPAIIRDITLYAVLWLYRIRQHLSCIGLVRHHASQTRVRPVRVVTLKPIVKNCPGIRSVVNPYR